MHLYRDPNGRYYFRYALPRALIRKLATHKHRELRLSLFTYHRGQADELAQAYWLACREILKNPEIFQFSTVDELKAHVRSAAMAHGPDQYTSLIELTGTADSERLAGAVRLLLAYHTDFFVLPPPGMRGTLRKKIPLGSTWDWKFIAKLNGQTFPHLKVSSGIVQDAVINGTGVMEPESLTYRHQDELRLLRLDHVLSLGFHHLFVRSDLQQSVVVSIRQLSQSHTKVTRSAPEPIPASKLLSEMIREYCDLKTTIVGADKRNRAWNPASLAGNQAKLNFFTEVVTDKPVLTIAADDIARYRSALVSRPKNRKKDPRLKGKTLQEIASLDVSVDVIDEATVKNDYNAVLAFFRWMKGDERHPGEYPTVNMSIETAFKSITGRRSKRRDPDEERQPFDADQLKLIFESDKSIDYLLENAKYGFQRWVVPMALYTGARLGEICQLYLHDIGCKGGTHFIEFNEKEQEKSIKNATSIRQIPVHPVLIELGLLEFVERVRAMHKNKTGGRLFYDLTYAPKTGYRRKASRWLNERYFEHIGITDERYDWHSFRHVVIGQLERADHVARWRKCCYTGHKIKGMSEAEKSYMNRKTLADMLPCLDAIKYDIDWTAYRRVLAKG